MSKDIKHNYTLEELFIQLDNCRMDMEALMEKEKSIIDLIYQATKEKATVGAVA